jgi:hypothetical protein
MFYFNQNLNNLSNHFLKKLILIRFKGIQAHYLYVYRTNFTLKNSHMIFFTFHSDMNPLLQKRNVTIQKKMI